MMSLLDWIQIREKSTTERPDIYGCRECQHISKESNFGFAGPMKKYQPDIILDYDLRLEGK